jgi:hypothetical protein
MKVNRIDADGNFYLVTIQVFHTLKKEAKNIEQISKNDINVKAKDGIICTAYTLTDFSPFIFNNETPFTIAVANTISPPLPPLNLYQHVGNNKANNQGNPTDGHIFHIFHLFRNRLSLC